MMQNLKIDEMKVLHRFLEDGYVICYEMDKVVEKEGVFNPLVQHHFGEDNELISESKYYISNINRDKEEDELQKWSFDTPTEVVDFILEHYKEGMNKYGQNYDG